MSAKAKAQPWDLPNPYHESAEYRDRVRGVEADGPDQGEDHGEACDCDGWEVVCPDGRVRHYPFHNKGDADADAKEMTSTRCQVWEEPSELEITQPPCPEGEHVVRAVSMRGAAVPQSN